MLAPEAAGNFETHISSHSGKTDKCVLLKQSPEHFAGPRRVRTINPGNLSGTGTTHIPKSATRRSKGTKSQTTCRQIGYHPPPSGIRAPTNARASKSEAPGEGQSVPQKRFEPIGRISFVVDTVILTRWPSRGGVIELGHATALGFELIGVSRVNPATWRDQTRAMTTPFSSGSFSSAMISCSIASRGGLLWLPWSTRPPRLSILLRRARNHRSLSWAGAGCPLLSRSRSG